VANGQAGEKRALVCYIGIVCPYLLQQQLWFVQALAERKQRRPLHRLWCERLAQNRIGAEI